MMTIYKKQQKKVNADVACKWTHLHMFCCGSAGIFANSKEKRQAP